MQKELQEEWQRYKDPYEELNKEPYYSEPYKEINNRLGQELKARC